jgi:hypothetical protein
VLVCRVNSPLICHPTMHSTATRVHPQYVLEAKVLTHCCIQHLCPTRSTTDNALLQCTVRHNIVRAYKSYNVKLRCWLRAGLAAAKCAKNLLLCTVHEKHVTKHKIRMLNTQ